MRMFAIIYNLQEHTDFSDHSRLINTLRSSRQVSMRDLVKWCQRASEVLGKESSEQIPEKLYQDVVDIFCNFIPDRIIKMFVDEEIAFTFNISKERASYFSSVHKPLAFK